MVALVAREARPPLISALAAALMDAFQMVPRMRNHLGARLIQAALPAIRLLMPFMSRLGNSSAALRGSVSSSASMRWIASGSPLTAAAIHARISSPRPAGRSAGNSVRAASASSR